MRVVFEQETVDVGASVAFVGIGNELLALRLVEGRTPFSARRKARAAAPAQAGTFDGANDAFIMAPSIITLNPETNLTFLANRSAYFG